MNNLTVTDEVEASEGLSEATGSLPAQFEVVAAITASMERDTSLVGNPFKSVLGNLWNLNSKAANDFIGQIEKEIS